MEKNNKIKKSTYADDYKKSYKKTNRVDPNEFEETRNWAFPANFENVTDPPVETELARVQTLVLTMAELSIPPIRSTCKIGFVTGLLNVIVTVWLNLGSIAVSVMLAALLIVPP